MNLLFLTSFADVMNTILYVLIAILVLLVMITVHEFGHYTAGKIFHFGIDEFSIGFGPKLYQRRKKNGELFTIRCLPLGGFCAFSGEDTDSTDPKAFNNKKPWQRIIVLISGAFMNYLLAVFIIMLMFGIYGRSALVPVDIVPTTEFKTENCFYSEKDSNVRDIIISANGKNIYLTSDLMNAIKGKEKGELVDFTVRRNGEDLNVKIAMRTDTHFENVEDMKKLYDALGFYYEVDQAGDLVNGGLYATSVRLGFFQTIGGAFDYSFKLAGTIFQVLGELLTGKLGISSMGGTITTISVTAQAVQTGGFRYLLNIASFIGVNLAVFNLLPIPALDGSRVIFNLIEWIFRKPVNRKVEGAIHTVGLILLMCFAVFVDLQQCF